MQKVVYSHWIIVSTIAESNDRLRHQLPRGEGLEFASPFIFSTGVVP